MMKIKRKIGLLCSLILTFVLSLNVFASEFTQLSPNENRNNLNYELNLSDYPQFNIADYEQYSQIFEYYNVNVDDIIAVIPASEIVGEHVTTRDVPAGVIILTGQFLSQYGWKLTVLNAGILSIHALEADVVLWNDQMGPILRSVRNIGPLGKFLSTSETYTQSYYVLEAAVVTVTGQTSEGEWFNVGAVHVR